jgi:Esterase-like activity of phytase
MFKLFFILLFSIELYAQKIEENQIKSEEQAAQIIKNEQNKQKFQFQKFWKLSSTAKLGKYKIGGLSGCVRVGQYIYFISDDRGGEGGARIISFPWNDNLQELQLTKPQVIYLERENTKKIYDLEGIGYFENKFLLSNEGDLNKKPRQGPEIFWMTMDGKRQSEVSIDSSFLPNLTGQQKRGIQNNFGFEGLVIDTQILKWSAILEGPKFNKSGALENYLDILEVNLKNNQKTYWKYPQPIYESDQVSTLMMGATELLYLNEDEFLVLERGLQFQLTGLDYRTQICLAKKNLEKNEILRSCTYQFENDIELLKNIQKTTNFEGLCWINEKKSQFLVVSDNNFSKNENTLFLLYNLN